MNHTIKDYTLKEFAMQPEELQAEYTRLLSFSEPLETNKTIWDLKLKHIDRLKTSELQDFEVIVKTIAKMQGVPASKIWSSRITVFFRLFNSLKEQLEGLVNAENALVPAHSNTKWEIVEGSKRMQKFGIYNTLIPLAKQLNTTIKGVNNMVYAEVFTILLRDKTLSDLQHEMNDIKLPK